MEITPASAPDGSCSPSTGIRTRSCGAPCAAGRLAKHAADRQFPNFAPRAKRVIFLFQAGGPSQLDLLDYKPEMKGRFNEDIPPSIFGGQRITGMVAQQDRLPVVAYDVWLPPARAERHVVQRAVAAHRRRSPTRSAFCAR